MEPENSTVDIPDERDIPYSELMGSSVPESIAFPSSLLIVQNQGVQYRTRMACSRYGMSHIVDAQTLLTENTQYVLGIDMWDRYLKQNPGAESNGASLQSTLSQATKEGLIAGYALVTDIESAKQAVDRGHFIYTGSFNGDWVSVRDRNRYALRTDGRTVGHVWIIVGYGDEGFTALNSYGPSNGYFLLPYDLFPTTFSKYAIVPKKEIDPFTIHEQKLMEEISIASAKDALNNHFWNGERPKDAVTREEAAAMAQRVFEAIKAGK